MSNNQNLNYAKQYINDVTTKAEVSAPDETLAGQYSPILTSLYDSHISDGVAGANQAWSVIRKLYPQLVMQSKLINFHDLHNIPIPDYILKASEDGKAPNYPIYLTGLNLIYGVPGSGKSFVAIDIAARLALANPDKIVIYSAGEGVPGLEPRLKAWEQFHKVHVSNLYLWKDALQFSNPDEVSAFMNEINNKSVAFLIVDTLARAMVGMNENDTREVGLFIHAVERLMNELQIGVLFVHHTNKMGIMRGSTAFDGSMDSIIKLQKEEELISLYNSLDRGGKNKHREEAPPIHFRLITQVVDGNNEAVIEISDKVMDDPDAKLNDTQVQILDALASFDDGLTAKAVVDMTSISQPTVYRNLKKLTKMNLISSNLDRFKITEAGEKKRSI
jgi:DNA-binding transcriptional ArsR family regulator